MDTHIAGDPALDSAPTLHARLPGEPQPGHGEAMAEPPLRAGPRTAAPPAYAARGKRRGVLLSSVAFVGVVVIAGGTFLVSPYNRVVAVPSGVRLAAAQAELRLVSLWHHPALPKPSQPRGGVEKTAVAARAPAAHPTVAPPPSEATSPPPLAPSASLANVHPAQTPPAVVQPPYKPQAPGQELAEVVDLGQNSPPSARAQAPSDLGSVQSQAAKPHAGSAAPPPPLAKSAPKPAPQAPHPAPPVASTALPPSSQPSEQLPPGGGAAALSGSAPAEPTDKNAGLTAGASKLGAAGAPQASAVAPKAGATPGSGETSAATAVPQPAPAVSASAKSTGSQAGTVHLAAAAPPNPLAVAEGLQAAPMSSDQQVQVLELVTQLATLIRDEHTQIANLQVDIQKTEGTTTAKLADFERRIALVEATTAMAAAAGPLPTTPPLASGSAATQPSGVPVALLSAKAALAGASQSPPPAVAPPAPSPAPVVQTASAVPKQYRVQAASPGLAMLAEVDRGGGDGAQLQVQVGDTIPGYGRVLSVQQQGTNWVVQNSERGHPVILLGGACCARSSEFYDSAR